MRFPLTGPHGGFPMRCQIVEVHDGDTVTVWEDRGQDDESKRRIRLRGDFAPELSQPGGPETRDFVKQWVHDNGDGSDWPFLLETYRTPKSDEDLTTLSRFVGVISAANGRVLNDDAQAFVTANGYPGGVGS